MKDRIKTIMESQHMTQQTFAQFIQISPASLSSIFNGRTKPTLTVVEAIRSKIPSLSLEWLMFGVGPMYNNDKAKSNLEVVEGTFTTKEGLNHFGEQTKSPTPSLFDQDQERIQNIGNTLIDNKEKTVKIIDRPQRKISEIRIFSYWLECFFFIYLHQPNCKSKYEEIRSRFDCQICRYS